MIFGACLNIPRLLTSINPVAHGRSLDVVQLLMGVVFLLRCKSCSSKTPKQSCLSSTLAFFEQTALLISQEVQ